MTKSITKKITGFKVKTADAEQVELPTEAPVSMSEHVSRPEVLLGSTYKVKTPVTEHAMYITINDVILNQGTDHEERRPFEIFVNSKNMENFQWIVALTRLCSAVFRKGGDSTFLVEELMAVFDPKGGYFKPGGLFMPSVVAEIGHVLKQHMESIGMLDSELDEHQKSFIEAKKAEYAAASAPEKSDSSGGGEYPDSATWCSKCSTKAVVLMDGCQTCLACGSSSCG